MLLEDVRTKDNVVVDAERDFDIRWTANSMYSASLDTVSIHLWVCPNSSQSNYPI